MRINIQLKMAFIYTFLITFTFPKTSAAQQKFDKAVFYDVMASGNGEAVNNEISIVQNASLFNKEGYEGALLMKKAGFAASPKKKLKFFKDGRIKLETALMVDNENTEFHFLRLAVEENAPKIVKYHADIEKDKLFIQKNFKNLPASVQYAILDYCKKSKILHADDFSPRSRDSF